MTSDPTMQKPDERVSGDGAPTIDWRARAVASEVAYSVARGGAATEHERYVHVHNETVPWGGDYNRAVGVTAGSSEELEEIIRAVLVDRPGPRLHA